MNLLFFFAKLRIDFDINKQLVVFFLLKQNAHT